MEIQQPIHGQEADAVDRMRKMFAGSPEPLRATGTDDFAIENSEFARSARRSAQDAKPCVPSATGCEDDAFKPPPKKAPKPLCIADLGEEVQASATDCESSGGGTRTCGRFQGKELHSIRSWGQTGDNFGERGDVKRAVMEMVRG